MLTLSYICHVAACVGEPLYLLYNLFLDIINYEYILCSDRLLSPL